MSSTDAPTDEDGGDHIEWHVHLKSLPFETTINTDSDISQREVKERATEELIEELRSGNAHAIWSLVARTPEQRERHKAMDEALRCEHCEDITQAEKREIIVDDDIEFVCPTCVDDLKDVCNKCKRSRDELDEGEAIEVESLHSGVVVEYLCSTCASDSE